MTGLANLQVSRQGLLLVVSLEGAVDLSNAAEITDQLFRAIPNTAKAVVIDLSNTTYLDSRGVHFLLKLLERLSVRQQEARLVVPDDSPLRTLFSILSMTTSPGIHATVEAASEEMRKHT